MMRPGRYALVPLDDDGSPVTILMVTNFAMEMGRNHYRHHQSVVGPDVHEHAGIPDVEMKLTGLELTQHTVPENIAEALQAWRAAERLR